MKAEVTPDADRKFLTLAQVAQRWGISHSSVLTLVYNGSLLAVDVSTNPKNRSRYVVGLDVVEAFEESRATTPPELPSLAMPRTRFPGDDVVEFFR